MYINQAWSRLFCGLLSFIPFLFLERRGNHHPATPKPCNEWLYSPTEASYHEPTEDLQRNGIITSRRDSDLEAFSHNPTDVVWHHWLLSQTHTPNVCSAGPGESLSRLALTPSPYASSRKPHSTSLCPGGPRLSFEKKLIFKKQVINCTGCKKLKRFL